MKYKCTFILLFGNSSYSITYTGHWGEVRRAKKFPLNKGGEGVVMKIYCITINI